MTSLDGFGFSFNGLGDYVLYRSNSSSESTIIHSRTCMAYSKVVESKATVFCGYALQETGLPLFELFLNMESKHERLHFYFGPRVCPRGSLVIALRWSVFKYLTDRLLVFSNFLHEVRAP